MNLLSQLGTGLLNVKLMQIYSQTILWLLSSNNGTNVLVIIKVLIF